MENVVANYDWTSAPRGSGIRKNAPKVIVTSYKIKSNQIEQALRSYLTIATGLNKDAHSFYEELYSNATTKEDNFIFPFFGDNIRGFSQTFGDTFQSGSGNGESNFSGINEGVKSVMGGVGELLNVSDRESMAKAGKLAMTGDIFGALKTLETGGSPGTYIESPMFYQYGKDDNPLSVSFVLYNTINGDSLEKNHSLIKKLTKINRPLRLNSIAVEPPRIYSVRVPGQRFIRWAWCQSFDVSLLGTKREIDGILTPEAYQVTMSFKSLTMEHAGFLDQT